MKTVKAKEFVIALAITALMSVISVNALAASPNHQTSPNAVNTAFVDHEALADKYENMAHAMQEKIEAQLEALSNKPRSSFFGRNGQHIKKHVAYKINEYDKAAQENMQKALHHKKIAMEQSARKKVAESTDNMNHPVNKAGKQVDTALDAL